VTRTPLSEEQMSRAKQILGVFRLKNILAGAAEQMVVGLADADSRVLALGILKKIDYGEEKFVLLSPLRSSEQKNIRIIQFGSLRVTDDGREAGFVPPGYF
jgi:polynucleotide 5'-kinase involved in rRNA processing